MFHLSRFLSQCPRPEVSSTPDAPTCLLLARMGNAENNRSVRASGEGCKLDVYILEKVTYLGLHIGGLPLVLLVNNGGSCMVQVASPALTVETAEGATFS